MSGATGAVASRYNELMTDRSPFLERARDAAKYTIPALLPPNGHSPANALYKPYQSVGARGLNHLASKLLITLFPPNSPFFRLKIDDFTLRKMTGKDDLRGQMEEALSSLEQLALDEHEASAASVALFEAMRHLIVAGNVLLHLPPTGSPRVFHLDKYVVDRDAAGNVLEIIVSEKMSPKALPDYIRTIIYAEGDKADSTEKNVEVYTIIKRMDREWHVWQEVCGKTVPLSEGVYPLDKCPWLALRLNRIDGESYGRGHVEEYIGDLIALEGLSMAILEGSLAAAKMLWFVNPNGLTKKEAVAKARNLDVLTGRADDISVLRAEKGNDFRVAYEQAQEIAKRLEFAFLLHTAIQRNGERVTAEEIRFMAEELESALGGTYSILSQELQRPYANLLMLRLQRAKKAPPLPKGSVKLAIVTGIEALGRGNDATKLLRFMKTVFELAPDQAAMAVNPFELFRRLAAADGINTKGLIKDEATVQALQQQAQLQQQMAQLGPQAVTAAGGIAKEGLKNGQLQMPDAQQMQAMAAALSGNQPQ